MLYPGVLPAWSEVTLGLCSFLIGVAAVGAGSSLIYVRTRRIVLSMVLAVCFLEALVFLSSEALSAVHSYTPLSLVLLWWVLAIGIILGAVRTSDASLFFVNLRVAVCRKWSPSALAFAAILLGVGSLLLITGLWTAPNNIDSLNYHLPRLMQWLQASHIASFATPYPAQVYLAPGAEQLGSILFVALRTDHAMFLAQWIAWLSVGGSVYYVASPRQHVAPPRWGGGSHCPTCASIHWRGRDDPERFDCYIVRHGCPCGSCGSP